MLYIKVQTDIIFSANFDRKFSFIIMSLHMDDIMCMSYFITVVFNVDSCWNLYALHRDSIDLT